VEDRMLSFNITLLTLNISLEEEKG